MMDVIKSLFTPEQVARIMGWLIDTGIALLDHALSVLWVVFLIFATTQFVKISWRRSSINGPPDWAVHGVSALSAGVWSYFQLGQHALDTRSALAVAAWFITWLLVTYGSAVLKAWRPTLWAAINFDRRKMELGPPPATNGRRKEDRKL